jgi:hypothetical protein
VETTLMSTSGCTGVVSAKFYPLRGCYDTAADCPGVTGTSSGCVKWTEEDTYFGCCKLRETYSSVISLTVICAISELLVTVVMAVAVRRCCLWCCLCCCC